MKHTLKLSVNAAEGAILRIIGLVERRGFSLVRIDAASAGDDGQLEMELDVVSPERSIDVLMRQLEKLFDVATVLLLQSDTCQFEIKESRAC